MTRPARQPKPQTRRDFLRAFAARAIAFAVSGTPVAACGDTRESRGQATAAKTPAASSSPQADPEDQAQTLPPPVLAGTNSLEETLSARRSVRSYASTALTWQEIGQLLWSAQGITQERTASLPGLRAAPSAGALYPLEMYVVTAQGLYHYHPSDHTVRPTPQLGLRQALWEPALKQDWVREAPAVFVLAAVYRRTEDRYGARAARYVHMEAGHAAENLLLQAVALGLGGVVIGAFYDAQVKKALNLPDEQEPLYLIPVGHPEE